MAKERQFLKTIIGTLVGAVVGGGFALLGVHYSANLTGELELKLKTIQKQKQLFSQLMGQREVRTHLYKSYVEVSVNTDYYLVKWEKDSPTSELKSLHLEQARFFQQSQANLIREVANNERHFFEIVGDLWVYFPNTEEFLSLIEPIYLQKQPLIATLDELEGKTITAKAFEEWKNDAIKTGKEFVEKEYGKRMDYLLKYLKTEIDKVSQ